MYDIPPSSVKGPVFSVPVGEIKPQGVYDIPPTKGVSELLQSSKKRVCACARACACVYWDKQTKEKQLAFVRVQGGKRRGEGGRTGNKDNSRNSIFRGPH